MLGNLEYAALGFETFHEDVLAPLIVMESCSLDISVHQCTDHIRPEAAEAYTFQRVPIGWRWGPIWSTAWFKLEGTVPRSMSGHSLSLHFSSGTEALLWKEGVPWHGFDPYHFHAPVDRPASGEVTYLIEAACNRPLGASLFWWEHQEEHQRWREDNPGRLEHARLEVRDETIERFCGAWLFAVRLMRTAREDSELGKRIELGLREFKRDLLRSDPSTRIPRLLGPLEDLLHEGAKGASTCFAMGHAHIDTAWLWTLPETRRKCLRTFATQLRNLERFPSFRFLCSQPQQYAFIEEESPKLFEQITRQVRGGRWEPFGAMWIEPDANIPSGESLIRQILHGTSYFKDRFGSSAPQEALYLPDTFGFPASLPQICRLAGLKTFITNKIAWSETNRFPHVTFLWRGIDGSEVLTHLTPGHNYNSSIRPQDFLDAEQRLIESDGIRCLSWLQPYGWGDGGGGPDTEQIRNAELGALSAGLPKVESRSATSFCEILHGLFGKLEDQPVWDGELYLELHRGTYTTHARLKASNRKAERELREIEALAIATEFDCPGFMSELRPWLDRTWKTVLLNQFHDILPGSSIQEVHEEAHAQLDRVHLESDKEIDEGLRRIVARLDTRGIKRPLLVWNPASTMRCAVVDSDAGSRFVNDIPPLGIRIIDLAEDPEPEPGLQVRATECMLDNGLIGVRIDQTGRVSSLTRRGHVIPCKEPLNTLVLHSDRPRRWEAWDIDRDHVEDCEEQSHDAHRISLVENSKIRGVIEYEKPIGKRSRIIQRYVLEAAASIVRIETRLDWNEDHMLLRALFTPGIRARFATFGIQLGCIERATHANTSWEQAAFEVPGHLWMDLSEHGCGLAILDDGSRIGRSCRGSTLGLSLLRATTFPDPTADRGVHEFTYALMPHDGNWREAGVAEEAECLGLGVRTIPAGAEATGSLRDGWQLLRWDPGSTSIEIVACKPAERGTGAVIRLVERHGGRGSIRFSLPEGITQVREVDLLEEPLELPGFERSGREVGIEFRPFQIRTLLLR